MPDTISGSEVLEFYNDAKILITGGTGFLGKALVEKLLRVCTNIDHVYLLIRMKKGKDPQARLKELLEDPVFLRLRKEHPNFQKKITCIPGDIASANLGLSENEFKFLTQEVTHVIHSAATVRFTEKLPTAILINVNGTYEIVKFCHKCIRLKILVHVSTAYSYCVNGNIAEDYYDPPISHESALTLMKILNKEKLDSVCSDLISPWPNTYSFTKAVSESVVKEDGKMIPSVIFRPGIVMGAHDEPVEGWVDNIYGPTGIIAAVGAGLMRVIYADENITANLVPVDHTVNALLCSAWEAGISWNNNVAVENSLHNSTETSEFNKKTEVLPKIYNFTVNEENGITWRDFRKINLNYGIQNPISQSLWYYTLTLTRNRFVYFILATLFHYLPGAVFDGFLLISGKKPQMLKAYRKMDDLSRAMSFFSSTKLVFSNTNTQKLWSHLSETDKILFPFDVANINWDAYLLKVIKGVRIYVFKENEESLPFAKRKLFLLWICHRLLQLSLVVVCFWILSKFFFLTESVVQIEDSIMMKPNLIRNSS